MDEFCSKTVSEMSQKFANKGKFQPPKLFHFKYNYWLSFKYLLRITKNEKLLKFQCRNENLITIHTIELLHKHNFEW